MSDTDIQDNGDFFVPRDSASDDNLKKTLQGMSEEEILAVVAEGLLAEKGMTDLEDDVKAEMVKDLVERMTEFVNRAILGALPEDKMAELNEKIEKDEASLEVVNQLVADSGIDANDVTTKALEKFREIYLGKTEE